MTPSAPNLSKPRALAQQRLSRDWDVTERHPPEPNPDSFRFMDLPLSIRQKIYLMVLEIEPGMFRKLNYLPTSAMRTLNWRLAHQNERSVPEYLNDQEKKDPSDPSKILSHFETIFAVSRMVRNECRAVVFANIVTGVTQSAYGGLQVLEDSGPLAWREMRNLVVRMQPCRCVAPYCVARGWPVHGSLFPKWEEDLVLGLTPDDHTLDNHDRYLDAADTNDQRTVCQWERICAGMAAHGQPDRLSLFLVCGVDDVALAKRLVQPLFSLPRLRDVSISFGQPGRNEVELRRLAQDTVENLLGMSQSQPFRFLHLPVELQVKILEQTPLLSSKLVVTNIDGEAFFTQRPCCTRCCDHGKECDLHKDWPLPVKARKVFCMRWSTAFCTRCTCWPAPISWFRVSHQFRDVTTRAFFSKVSFEVLAWQDLRPRFMFTSENCDLDRNAPKCFLNFLLRLGARSMGYLRHVTFCFPPLDPSYLTPQMEAWSTWLKVIDLLAEHADLPALELKVCVARHKFPGLGDDYDPELLRKVLETDEEDMLDAYKQMFEPLKKLRALKAFYIYLAWPYRNYAYQHRRQNERMLEKMVMGEDYDSRKSDENEAYYWCYTPREYS